MSRSLAAFPLQATIGTATYAPDRDSIIWAIRQFPGQTEVVLHAHFGLPSISADPSDNALSVIGGAGGVSGGPSGTRRSAPAVITKLKAPIRVRFEIPYFTVSGIQVRYLKIVEKSGYTYVALLVFLLIQLHCSLFFLIHASVPFLG